MLRKEPGPASDVEHPCRWQLRDRVEESGQVLGGFFSEGLVLFVFGSPPVVVLLHVLVIVHHQSIVSFLQAFSSIQTTSSGTSLPNFLERRKAEVQLRRILLPRR